VGSNPNANKPLANRISDHKKSVKSYRINMSKVKCYNCRKYGHYSRDCKKQKKNHKDKDRGGGGSSKEGKGDGKAEKSNIMEVAFNGKEDDGEYYNFDVDCTNNDKRLIWYDWLADNATTSHVSHQREAFISYTPLHNISVTGVGGKVTNIKGKGTVKLLASCNGKTCILMLKDVLHVPGQPHNLISLGRWDKASGHYSGSNGIIILKTKDGNTVAKGHQINNNLYKMDVQLYKTNTTFNDAKSIPGTFVGIPSTVTWETWHRRFGHMGYSGLQKLLNGNMVEGFDVDINSPKPDCIACTEAKQHIKPFPKAIKRSTKPGELTHIDLWGKYAVNSINITSQWWTMPNDM
jgi:hypothetical protein